MRNQLIHLKPNWINRRLTNQSFNYFLILVFICIGHNVHAQWNHVSSYNYSINKFYKAEDSKVWAIGDNGMLIYSDDSFSSWNPVNTGFDEHFNDIYFYFNVGFLVGDNGTLLMSYDNGLTWEQKMVPTEYDLTSISFVSFEQIYIGAAEIGASNINGDLLKSITGGLTWTKMEVGANSNFFTRHVGIYDIHFVDDNMGFAVGRGYIGITNDGGDNWDYGVFDFTQSEFYSEILVNQDELYFPVVGNSSSYVTYTTDFGQSFSNSATPVKISSYAVINNLLVGYTSDAHYTAASDLSSWMLNVTEKPDVTETIENIFDLGNNLLIAFDPSGYNSILTSTNQGQDWNIVLTTDVTSVEKLDFPSPNIGYAVNNSGHVFKSTNDGHSWKWVGQPRAFSTNYPTVISFYDENNGLVIGSNGCNCESYVYQTNDGGRSWEESFVSDVSQFDEALYITLDTILITTWNDFSDGVYRTTDGGANWLEMTNSRPTYDIENEQGKLYALSESFTLAERVELAVSLDSGKIWDKTLIQPNNARTLEVIPERSLIYFGSFTGLIYKSIDNGISWTLDENQSARIYDMIETPRGIAAIADGGTLLSGNFQGTWQSEVIHDFVNSDNDFLDIKVNSSGSLFIAGEGVLFKNDNFLINTAPEISSPLVASGTEDVPFSYTASAIDEESDPVNYSIANHSDWLSITGNTISGTPTEGILEGSFDLIAEDDNGGAMSKTISITVTPVNDAPVITSPDTAEGTEDVLLSYLASATDIENDNLTYSIVNHSDWLSITGNTISGTPTEGILEGSFDLIAEDDNGGAMSKTISITVTPVNDAPVITSPDTAEGTEDVLLAYTATATDIENDNLTYSIVNHSDWLSITGHTISGTPTEGILEGSFDLLVEDDNGGAMSKTISITVTPVNDAPVITSPDTAEGTEDVLLSYIASATDIENDNLSYSIVNHSDWLSITGNTISGTPTEGILEESFDLLVEDGNGGAMSKTISITIMPVNDAPVITSPYTAEGTEDVLFSYTATATDIENDNLSYSIVNHSDWLSITGNTISGIPTEGILEGSFDLIAEDDNGGAMSKTVSITVMPVNDAPTISSIDKLTITQSNQEANFSVILSDPDNDPSTLVLRASTGNAIFASDKITLSGTDLERDVLIDLNNVNNGTEMVTLTVSDGDKESSVTVEVEISVVLGGIGQNAEFKIYPNPIKDFLSVNIETSEIWQIRILDISGKVYLNRNFRKKEVIDVAGLKSGVYIVELTTFNKSVVKKVLKL